MWAPLLILLGAGTVVGGGSGYATYSLFTHIMPRDTGVPLGCIAGVFAGLGVCAAVVAKLADGTEWP